MNKTILLTGPCGCGKTTIANKIKEILNINNEHIYSINNKKIYYYTNNNHVYLLGRYDVRKFSGLDTISKKSYSIDLINNIISKDENAKIICEGTFYKNYNYTENICICINDEILLERLQNRIKNKKTKNNKEYLSLTNDKNIIENKIELWHKFIKCQKNKGFKLMNNNTPEETDEIINTILDFLK